MRVEEITALKNLVIGISAKSEDLLQKIPFRCLYPNCSSMPVGCHSQQCNGALSAIAKDGKVIIPSKDNKGGARKMFDGKNPYRAIYAENIKEATKFKGFCKIHDDSLFSSIEKHPLEVNDNVQLIAFQRRAVAVELRRSIELLCYFNTEKELFKQRSHSLKGLDREIFFAQERLKTIMLYEWNPLWRDIPQNYFYYVWRVFPRKFPISLVSTILPHFDGRFYAIYSRVFREYGIEVLPRLGFTLTIVPQEEQTHIVMIWNKFSDPVLKTYCDRLRSKEDSEVESFLNECVFCLSEDWCMNPDYWDAISEKSKDELRLILSNDNDGPVKNIPRIITL